MDQSKSYWMLQEIVGHCIKRVMVRVTDTTLVWSFCENGINHTTELKSRQILAPKVISMGDHSILDVYYVSYVWDDKKKMKIHKDVVTFIGARETCRVLRSQLQMLLQRNESHRPTRWLILINPTSGWGASVKTYENVVTPLLELCGVTAHAIETESENHASEILATYDLLSIDALVSMGGDGMANQVTDALRMRILRDDHADMNDPCCQYRKPRVCFGSLPCGSANVIAFKLTGNTDVAASTMSIILGNTIPANVLAVYDDTKLLRHSNIDLVLGHVCNVGHILERLRWMQMFRFILAIPLMWWFWSWVEYEVEYLEVKDEDKLFRLALEAGSTEPDTSVTSDKPKPGWKTSRVKSITTQIQNINFCNTLHHLKEGMYRTPCLSADGILLVMSKPMNFLTFLTEFMTCLSKGQNYMKASLIPQIEVTECRLRAITSWSLPGRSGVHTGHDGEIVLRHGEPVFHVKVHKDCLDMYAVDDEMVQEAMMFAQNGLW